MSRNKTRSIVAALAVILAAIVFVVDLSIPLGVAGGVPYVTVVLVCLWSPQRRDLLLVAIICTGLTLLGYFYSPSGGEWWKVLFNRALAIYALWVVGTLGYLRRQGEDVQRVASAKDLLQSNAIRGEQARAMTVLFDLSRSLATAGSVEDIAALTATATGEVMVSRRVSVMLTDNARQTLFVASAIGIDDRLAAKILVPVGDGIAGAVFASGEPTVCNSESEVHHSANRHEAAFF